MAIRKILLNILGEQKYLSLLATAFQRLFPTGLLGESYYDIYFLRELVVPGAYCADIGAHLGYFSLELSRLTGQSGKVIAIEPMPAFHQTLQRLLQRKRVRNVTLLQVAVGGSGEYVEMGIPQVGKMKKFAHARVMSSSAHLEYVETARVKNETGDHLFKDLPRLDYIKCDVEGLEVQVIGSMMETLQTHHPMLLCELFERNERIRLFELVKPLGYQAYILEKGKLHLLDVYAEGAIVSQNDYFIPPVHRERLRHLFAS